MTDARIVATNPADSTVVPVACNENGELLLAETSLDQFVEKDGDTMTGNLHMGDKIILNPDGSAQFANGAFDLYQDGTAELTSFIQIGGSPFNDDGVNTGVRITPNGVMVAAGPLDNSQILVTKKTGEAVNTSEIFADGSATFTKLTGRTQVESPFIYQIRDEGESVSFWSEYHQIRRRRGGGRSWPEAQWSIRSDSSNDYARTNLGLFMKANYGFGESPQFEFTSLGWIIASGGATFKSDVNVGSRGKIWTIVESGGLAHLVEITSRSDGASVDTADLVDELPKEPPQLRNIPQELTMVEQQLQKVMEKLRMAPEAGWEVWDGSD